jgi:catechol 2,3-dioxygenase-like lactoylglutathione lyase family enzyme
MADLVIDSIAVDCPDPAALATFYASLLGVKAGGDWINPFGDDTEIWFQQVEGYQPPTWPTQERGQQGHFELVTNNIQAAAERAESLGATRASVQPGQGDEYEWIVMLDPAGHPFCLVPPLDNVEPRLTPSQRESDTWIGLGAYTIDCPDGEQLWHFYRKLADLKQQDVNGAAPALVADTGMIVLIQQVDDYAAPTWPTQERGQQMHIDFHTSDREGHVQRAIDLGATFQVKEKGFTVLLDPAGHPFCICDDN